MIVSNSCNRIIKICAGIISHSHSLRYRKLPVLLSFLLIDIAYAGDSVPAQNEAISLGHILNLVSGLIIVLFIFFGIAYLIKRISGINGMNRGHIKVVDALHLGSRERLILVKVTDIYMLLGISSCGINTLHVINELPDDLEQLSPDIKTRFRDLLSYTKLKRS